MKFNFLFIVVLMLTLSSCSSNNRFELDGYYNIDSNNFESMLKFTKNNLDSVFIGYNGREYRAVKFTYTYNYDLLRIKIDPLSMDVNDRYTLFNSGLRKKEIPKNIEMECAVLSPRKLVVYVLYDDNGFHLPDLEYHTTRPEI